MELEADDHQLDCPFLYAVGREGVAMHQPDDARNGLTPLFDQILETMLGALRGHDTLIVLSRER